MAKITALSHHINADDRVCVCWSVHGCTRVKDKVMCRALPKDTGTKYKQNTQAFTVLCRMIVWMYQTLCDERIET